MTHDVFISHSTKDRSAADALCATLEAAGIRCWIAPRDVIPGVNYSGEITRAVNASKIMVLVFSEHSNVSQAVLNEVVLAADARVNIVNFRVDDSPLGDDLNFHLRSRHWLEAQVPPVERHHIQLVNSVRALLGPGSAGSKTDATLRSRPAAPPSKAIFLSYAREDREAVAVLRATFIARGIVLWGEGQDQESLLGGDWESEISEAIQRCRLFVPLVSAATEARGEGFFRLEWNWAVKCSEMRSKRRKFILPVILDETDIASANVPEVFLTVQAVRCPGGRPPHAFLDALRTELTGSMRW